MGRSPRAQEPKSSRVQDPKTRVCAEWLSTRHKRFTMEASHDETKPYANHSFQWLR